MKKFIRKIMICSLSIMMLFCSFISKVNAEDGMQFGNLEQYAMSGDGSEDNPYVLNENEEEVKDYFKYTDEISKKNIENLLEDGHEGSQEDGNPKKAKNIFDASLTGKTYNAPKGGYWLLSKTVGSTKYDGVFNYVSINYAGYNATNAALKKLNKNSKITKLTTFYSLIRDDKLSFGSLLKYLREAGFTTPQAEALAPVFGIVSKSVAVVDFFATIQSESLRKTVKNAVANNKGMLYVQYKTTYHGKWYQHNSYQEWSTMPKAKTPGSYYGKGRFKYK